MKLADKFNIPIITLIDTKGAYAGLESEERHIAEAIAVIALLSLFHIFGRG